MTECSTDSSVAQLSHKPDGCFLIKRSVSPCPVCTNFNLQRSVSVSSEQTATSLPSQVIFKSRPRGRRGEEKLLNLQHKGVAGVGAHSVTSGVEENCTIALAAFKTFK